MRDLLDTPFDQYQRYKLTEEAFRLLKAGDGDPWRVLDAGGFPGLLADFLPGERVYILDLLSTKRDGHLVGDVLRMPFRDGAFRLVVSLDVLEHLRASEREVFLEEMLRVGEGRLILGAPFRDAAVEQAEEFIDEWLRACLGEEDLYLREHRERGLPDLAEVRQFFTRRGFSCVEIPNGFLFNWLVMMAVRRFVVARVGGDALGTRMDRFYNSVFYPHDQALPCYRRILLVSRQADEGLLAQVQAELVSPAGPHTNLADRLIFGQFVLSALQFAESEFVRSLQTRLEELEAIAQQRFGMISEKNGHIANLQASNRELQEHIRNFRVMVGEKDGHIVNLQRGIAHLQRELETPFWRRVARRLRRAPDRDRTP